MPQQSPLQDISAAAGAVFADAAGWSLPAHYGNPEGEYQAVLTGAGLFDYSHAAKVELGGLDAPMFLGNLSTNDVKNLPLGGGCEAYFCDARGKVQFQTWIYHLKLGDGRHAMWVETTPRRATELVKYLDRYLISERVEIADRTADFAQLRLAGPTAKTVLEKALGDQLPDLPEFGHMERTFGANATCAIRRHDPLGLPGFDLICRNDRAEGVWRMLTAAGAVPAGLVTHEVLRVEAGTPVFGPDIDENRFVMEVGNAPRAVSYSKGCFLGQEPIVMARDRAGHVNRAFLGLKVLEGGPLPAGAKVFRDGQEVGLITSSTQSPRLGVPVALAYLRWKHQDVGTRMEAETPVGRQPVEVLGLPPVR
ncbi:MAG: gcvT 1 [Gemmataceae bacterium]|nr:gcvT 1 [Gemmataceae bacterium]